MSLSIETTSPKQAAVAPLKLTPEQERAVLRFVFAAKAEG